MIIFETPWCTRLSMAIFTSGLPPTSTNAFGRESVRGRSRVPSPAARMNACMMGVLMICKNSVFSSLEEKKVS